MSSCLMFGKCYRGWSDAYEATANYLIHCDSLKEIYEKSDNGEYYPAYEPTGYGYYDNDTSPPRIQFLESAKANTDTTGKILSKDFYRMWDNNYFRHYVAPAQNVFSL